MKTIVIAFTALITLSNSSFAQDAKRPASKVIIENISFSPIQVTIETVGTAEAYKSVSLYPAAADRVTNVTFKPGDFVEKGTVLLELDARREIAAVKRAKIELNDKQSDVDRLLKSQVNGAVTESEVEAGEALRDLALVSISEATADLEDRKLLAPFSGYLGLTDVEIGDRISQSTLVTTIDDRSQLFVNFSIPESSYNLVAEDTAVSLEPWNSRGTILNANLAQLDSRVDVENRTLKVRALLNNIDDQFRPGLSFKVTLSAQGEVYPVVPEAALAWGATGSYIWLIENNKAVKKPVTIKQRLRGTILVEGDLTNNDVLIVEGIQRLREGADVSPTNMLASKQ